jgi:SAM-dependent methyltransferase
LVQGARHAKDTRKNSDFADEFPEAEVTGTDLSPIQPSWVLPNCSFEIDNAELEWTFADNTFDYIHIRGLIGSIEDWPKLYSECLRCLKPGGWFEQQEFALPIASNEDPFPDDCIWHLWEKIFREAGRKTGRTFELTDHWVKWMEEAGFRDDIHTDSVRLPLGNWPLDKKFKDVGIINRTSFEQGLEGYASYLCTQVLGWRQEEVTVLLAKVRQVIKNKSYHAYYPL